MPRWMKKVFVILVTILTLGTVVPTVNYHSESKPKQDIEGQKSQDSNIALNYGQLADVRTEEVLPDDWHTIATSCGTDEELLSQLKDFAKKEAETQGFEKFGDIIAKEIGDSYKKQIVPKFADAVAKMGMSTDQETLRHLAVSHNPAAGTGERILHFYDDRTGQELIKFHVRRDHPPLDGYWFNFHYHTEKDNFQGHHELGKIYWDKNTPPKWMA
ncbi:YpjP family protein [Camelliibacillus cellulosilyticus]|uniref:YpjP family protein n=1 Tax=Camelliibacillus cellulosilyticus TaxID=2174486 RepID=A0ABV9GJV3_9BACL